MLSSYFSFFFFSSRRRHTRFDCDWSSDVCSSDLADVVRALGRIDLRVRMRADADQGLRPEDGARRLQGQVVPSEMDAVRLCAAGTLRAVVDQGERPPGAQLARLPRPPLKLYRSGRLDTELRKSAA